ncbi:hypothetical protein NDU88_004554 [Pleurodeles waltl]|uniref:Uncharacterized protein n=1 Tax=Pleurodeles waltl TaxID=8319 RepID=A0AAV7W9C3_PLEWA|nr:hypothetical protein NDU88_004554 [Pleurodeles waltl]
MAGARAGGGQDEVNAGDAGGAGRQVSRKVSKGNGHASLPVAGVTDGERLGGSPGAMMSRGGEKQPWGQGQSTTSGEEGLVGQLEGMGGGERETVLELSHILEWSDKSDQGGGEVRDQEVEEDGLVFKVRPPIHTYGGFGRGEAVREEVVRVWGPEFKRKTQSVGVRSLSDIDVGFLQGVQCGSEDGDPGEPLAGSEPWEEEEVTAGPSTASWTGYRRGGKAVRAKEVVKQYTTGPGFAPPSGRVSKGKRPGYASQREGHKTALRRPRVPVAQLEELIKKARFGNKSGDTDTDEIESGDTMFHVAILMDDAEDWEEIPKTFGSQSFSSIEDKAAYRLWRADATGDVDEDEAVGTLTVGGAWTIAPKPSTLLLTIECITEPTGRLSIEPIESKSRRGGGQAGHTGVNGSLYTPGGDPAANGSRRLSEEPRMGSPSAQNQRVGEGGGPQEMTQARRW